MGCHSNHMLYSARILFPALLLLRNLVVLLIDSILLNRPSSAATMTSLYTINVEVVHIEGASGDEHTVSEIADVKADVRLRSALFFECSNALKQEPKQINPWFEEGVSQSHGCNAVVGTRE